MHAKTGMPRAFLLTLSFMLLGTLFGIAPRARAQARPSPAQNDIAGDPLDLLLGGSLNVQYEFKTSPVNSWALRGHFWSRGDFSGFGLGAAYRFYIADSRALTGLSVAPAADLFFFSNDLGYASTTDILIGGDLAYKWIFDQFSVEPILTLRIGIEAGNAPTLSYATGLVAGLGVYLGYAW